MEKYSAYRDPGTGIQPFLIPVPPFESEFLSKLLAPIGYTVGILRTSIVFVVWLLYVVLLGFCVILTPIPPLHRLVTGFLTTILARLVLFIVGLPWIPVEPFTRKRSRGATIPETWVPRAGDIIVSNWVSWLEILYLAFRFNPTFVVPVSNSVPPSFVLRDANVTGRRTGTGSANVPSTRASVQLPIDGLRTASLLTMIGLTGHVLPTLKAPAKPRTLEEIRMSSNAPLVVFPECTTSNGRGLLRFANMFSGSLPIKGYKMFLMCVRYDPPTTWTPTPSLSIPSTTVNPLAHVFKLSCALVPPSISIRMLAPSESPGAPTFITSEVSTSAFGEDAVTEVCATLIAQMGKMKRVGMGWEDKSQFLGFYREKRR
ncbi:hypothetical protein FISHEDRAFT_66395 [Fistulina hepatica ATCC 64428]|uniref:Phospholipid/glycerol acyltransferase domain-containing protein n=1 Tax=Fistulina hepatica ATCC 64428 TaxID=1128425 RepID=A0A0D7A9L5_9AGAR|nr:hypothetical protein FISHEDRAFT_66395 [Fistulina hepatica ATCC 64428]